MNRKRFISRIVLATTLFLCLSINAFAQEGLFYAVDVQDGSNLSVVNCVALAFKNSPKIRREKYNLDMAVSNVGIAKSRYFPELNAGAGYYYERNSDSIYYDRRYRELPNVGVSINKMIWDFGKTTSYIKMEELYKAAAEYQFMDSLCEALFDVKEKYYSLLRAQALLQVSKNNIELSRHIIDISHGDVDLVNAELNLSKALIENETAQNNYNNAKANLANAMYIDSVVDFEIQKTPTFNFNNEYYFKKSTEPSEFSYQNLPFTRDKAIDIAYSSSPELKVLESTRDAMIHSLNYVKKTYLPELNTNVGYGYYNTNHTSDNSLRVGVNLDASINLMELRHSIKGADAQVKFADNEVDLFKKDLYFELKRAFNNLDKAEAQIKLTRTNAKEAIEYLKLIENQYVQNSPSIDYLSLQDAKFEYINAVTSYIDSIYNYNIALIQVEMAMHCHIVDVHHKSEHAITFHADELLDHLNKVLDCDEKESNKKSIFRKIKENL